MEEEDAWAEALIDAPRDATPAAVVRHLEGPVAEDQDVGHALVPLDNGGRYEFPAVPQSRRGSTMRSSFRIPSVMHQRGEGMG